MPIRAAVTPPVRNPRVLAVLGVGLLAGTAHADFTVFSDFSNFAIWGQLQLNGFANLAPLSSGGNPGGYVRIGSSLQNSTFQAGGFLRGGQFVSLAGVTQIRMTFDYQFLQGTALSIVPVLVQETRAYLPTAFNPGTPSTWTTFSNIDFARSTFIHSSGIPLNDAIPTRVGFVGFIRSETPISTAGTAGVDNITIQGIPAPSAAALLCISTLAIARRRR